VNEAQEPTELVYAPRPSWLPALTAAGLGALVAGLFTWWPYGVIGAVVLVLALRRWLRDSGSDLSKRPRRQPLSTAPLPLTEVPPADEG
jgi:hypothetical protein